jgi:hypothetical protein
MLSKRRSLMTMKTFLPAIVCLALAMTCSAQLDASQLPAQPENKGFEDPSILGGAGIGADPTGWFYFASSADGDSGVTDARKKEGMQSCFFKAQKTADGFQGIGQRFAAAAGTTYTLSVSILIDPANLLVGESFGQISIEWQDANGVEITRTIGPTWNSAAATGDWKKFTVEGEAPANTAAGVGVITFFSKQANGVGTFYVDDCEFGSRVVAKP